MSTQQTIAVPAGAGNERLSWFTRISYALGDTATNIVAGAMTILTFFYTDYAGVAPTTVGLVMLLSRIFDGMSDLLMGGSSWSERIHAGASRARGCSGRACRSVSRSSSSIWCRRVRICSNSYICSLPITSAIRSATRH